MEKLILYTGFICTGISIIVLPIFGLILYLKEKCISKFILFLGLFMIGIGDFLQIISPVRKITLDETYKIISSSGTPYHWYMGSFIFQVGIIITAVGFALIIFKIFK